MITRLLWLLLFLLIGWWVRGLLRGMAGRPSAAAGRRAGGRQDMVRDRVCNTFLPRQSALKLREGGEEHFFCSEACRSTFLRQAGAGS